MFWSRDSSLSASLKWSRDIEVTRAVFSLFCVLMMSVAAKTASAQGRRLDERPTKGVLVFGGSLVGPPEAWSQESNPAALAFLRKWSLSLHHTEMDGDGSRGGTGDALFWAQKIPFVPIVYGLSAQYVRWPEPFGAGYGDVGKLGLSIGCKLGHWAGLGLSVSHFIGPGSEGLEGLTTWDLAGFFRPWSHLAFGVKVSDIFMPRWWHGLPLQRVWDFEVGWRPLGTSRLTLALGAGVGERRRTVDPRFGVEWRLWRGIFFRGDLEYIHRTIPMDDVQGEEIYNDFRATMSLAVNFSRWGFGVGVAMGRAGTVLPGGVFGGAGGWVRVSGVETKSVYYGGDSAVVLKVPGESASERAFVGFFIQGERVLQDASVAAVIIPVPDEGVGWARAQEVRRLIQRMQGKKKKVIAVVKTPGNVAYYLASAADWIWIAPSGGLMVSGLTLSRLYFKPLLNRVGVDMQFIKHGDYKTAPEAFEDEGPSPEAEEVNKSIVKEIYGDWVEGVSKRSALKSERNVRHRMKSVPFTPDEALKWGFVDDTIYEDEVDEKLKKLLGRRVRFVSPKKAENRRHEWGRRGAVAVVVVEGDIISGESRRIPFLNRFTAGDATLIRVLRKMREDGRIKAVVLRINSPGGSSGASNKLKRELTALRKVKPVIASLSNVAASGGYELAVAAEKIYAQPATITGSIGIFAGKPDVGGLLKKIGVNVHQWSKGPFPGLKSPYVPYTEEQKKILKKKLREHYMRFVKSVADGRPKMNVKEVERVARGRVWTGAQAKDRGLVDGFGDVGVAVAWARRRAGLPKDAPVLVYPEKRKGLLLRLARGLITPSSESGKGMKTARSLSAYSADADGDGGMGGGNEKSLWKENVGSRVAFSFVSLAAALIRSIPPSFLYADQSPLFARMLFELRLE